MGAQIGFMLYTTVFTLFFGLISPYTRTYVFIYGYFMLAIGNIVNGYLSAYMMKWFGSSEKVIHSVFAAFGLPVYILVSLIFIDFVEYEEHSDSYIPLTSLAFYAFLWLLFSIPLSFYGSYRGFRELQFKKFKANALKRAIPKTRANSFGVVITQILLSGAFIFSHVAI